MENKQVNVSFQNDLIVQEPRRRKQTARYGNQDQIMDMSELETSDSDYDEEKEMGNQALGRGRRNIKGRGEAIGTRRGGRRGRRGREDDDGMDGELPNGTYVRSECFKVEKHLLVYG